MAEGEEDEKEELENVNASRWRDERMIFFESVTLLCSRVKCKWEGGKVEAEELNGRFSSFSGQHGNGVLTLQRKKKVEQQFLQEIPKSRPTHSMNEWNSSFECISIE